MPKSRRRRNGSRAPTRPGRRPAQQLPTPGGHRSGATVPDDERQNDAGARAGAEQATMLIGLITSGALDHHLALLTRVIGQRQRHLLDAASVRALAAIDVGDRVRVNQHIRPLYLQGSTGTVTGWSGRSALVVLDVPNGRFAEVRCPPLGLDRLDSP